MAHSNNSRFAHFRVVEVQGTHLLLHGGEGDEMAQGLLRHRHDGQGDLLDRSQEPLRCGLRRCRLRCRTQRVARVHATERVARVHATEPTKSYEAGWSKKLLDNRVVLRDNVAKLANIVG